MSNDLGGGGGGGGGESCMTSTLRAEETGLIG